MTRRWLRMVLVVMVALASLAAPVLAEPDPGASANVVVSVEFPLPEPEIEPTPEPALPPEAAAAAMVEMETAAAAAPAAMIETEPQADTASEAPADRVATSAPELAPVIIVQATSWVHSEHLYVLTVVNLTPWHIPALALVDRYIPVGSDQAEVIHGWFADAIAPNSSVSKVIVVGALWPEACHQLELSLADGMGAVLMDCSRAGSTTLWSITLNDEMREYLSSQLTNAVPTGRSKAGLHVTYNSSPDIMKYVVAARPAVIAAVGDLGWLVDVKAASPETITLGRLIEGSQAYVGDPAEQARAYVQAAAGAYRANPGVDYWLGWNEPGIDEIGQMRWYAAFEAERIVAMAELGLKAAIGNFSTGTPEPAEFEAFLPAIRVAREYGAVLALHEYSAPTMYDGLGAGVPGIAGREGFGALTLRYRYWYEHYLRPNDLIIPLIITEAGIDGGVLRLQDSALGGWRDFDGGDSASGLAVQTAQSYLEQLSWYDDQLRRDPYVLGFAIFNVGEEDGRWESFDVTDLLPDLQEMAAPKQ